MRTAIGAMAGSFLVTFTVMAAAQQPRQPLTVTGHLQGYSCMMLNLTNEQLADWENAPAVLAEPSPNAAKLGVASANVIVAEPRREVNGYLQMLHMDGRPGWIVANKVVAWRNVSNPQTRCIPAMMSNNRPGFDYIRPRG
ncbi:hypothetical protein D9599_25185 [Roseomonas sp. KE2513]|uniref:hypothetical protein n=1 Tax=Roseomonas sp. KE2513 TaxID=2479202 RepID=UPI0018DF9DD3|nr:hypothetical protein [Roseomonas sp. KE2513]MBI0538850.1 hypothetical protein [Roseomonas sp. KE2513]